MNAFSLNHCVEPAVALGAFFDLAVPLGMSHVEIRNELPAVATADDTSPKVVRDEAETRGLNLLSINTVYLTQPTSAQCWPTAWRSSGRRR